MLLRGTFINCYTVNYCGRMFNCMFTSKQIFVFELCLQEISLDYKYFGAPLVGTFHEVN
jgi:hypothetical protein